MFIKDNGRLERTNLDHSQGNITVPSGSPQSSSRVIFSDTDLVHHTVTLHVHDDLDQFYADMEAVTGSATIPDRPVSCIARRPSSRNTDYQLSLAEADQIRNDPRVSSVELHPTLRGFKASVHTNWPPFGYNTGTWTPVQDPGNWNYDKSSEYFGTNGVQVQQNPDYGYYWLSNVMVNWGLVRSSVTSNPVNWGNTCPSGPDYGWGTSLPDVYTSASHNIGYHINGPIGRNVDIVVNDAGNPDPNHPEFAVNYDGSGGSRMFEYDWYSLDPIVKGKPETSQYPLNVYGNDAGVFHSYHCSGIAAGNRQGWARGANIYNIAYTAGDDQGGTAYCFPYIKAFHQNKPVNPNTGRRNPTITSNSWGYSIRYDLRDRFSGWNAFTITQIKYRGTTYTPITQPGGYNQISVGNTSTYPANGSGYIWQFSLFPNTQDGQSYSVRTTVNSATASAISAVPNGTNGLSNMQAYDSASVYDYFWFNQGTPNPNPTNPIGAVYTLTLPWSITVLGTTTNKLFVYSTGEILVGGPIPNGASIPSDYHRAPVTGANIPGLYFGPAQIVLCLATVQSLYAGTTGVSPNRIYKIRMAAVNSYVTSPAYFPNTYPVPNTVTADVIMEYWFYENDPRRIDVLYVNNPSQFFTWPTAGSSNAFDGLLNFHIPNPSSTAFSASGMYYSELAIPVPVASVQADVQDAIAAGVIVVTSAGNSGWKRCLPTDPDYNNTLRQQAYPNDDVPYLQGQAPSAATSTNLNIINVGAMDDLPVDQKVPYSNCGPAVDIWAPGTGIMSAITPFNAGGTYSGVNDMRNNNYQLAKLSGTSMSCPQVAGVIACHLENNPSLTPAQAKAWVLGAGLRNQLTAGNGGMYDGTDLQGSQNVMLYLPPTATPGQVWPIDNWQPLPSSGQIWPRTNNINGSV